MDKEEKEEKKEDKVEEEKEEKPNLLGRLRVRTKTPKEVQGLDTSSSETMAYSSPGRRKSRLKADQDALKLLIAK